MRTKCYIDESISVVLFTSAGNLRQELQTDHSDICIGPRSIFKWIRYLKFSSTHVVVIVYVTAALFRNDAAAAEVRLCRLSSHF